MRIFKFGGASIQTIERMKSTGAILKNDPREKMLLVISAMGKTTNALEKVAESFFSGNSKEALSLFNRVKQQHLDTLKYITVLNWQAAENRMKDFFTEVEWLLHDKPVKDYDFYYDQIVCCGELLSTWIMYQYCVEEKLNACWVDVRDIIRTDDNFREAAIDWAYTQQKVETEIKKLFHTYDIVITQGFIGATDENESTTLGREGSDFTAAIFANLLDASSLTIWKDVDAVMNADPRQFKDAIGIPSLSYSEVIEMAYYGAQVIHPKTIKPLQNKNIPLYVKSFLNPQLPGTLISSTLSKKLPPVIVKKENQVLMQFSSKDFSFVEGKPVQQLQEIFKTARLNPNLIQNSAISLLCCFDDRPEKIEQIALEAGIQFNVSLEKNLTLLTIRHYDDDIVKELTENKTIVLLQKTPVTLQALFR
ncbi:MAG: aspartate kinase [Niastella sp. SCN 39-18]|mgnify:CR=1 FL=1|nr:aspartate kinase [Sphingobacteriales bacterium]ODT51591.1 MAG: aspartate kinase [Niastella sp. SCN 39-18]OJW08262.1 MAG: aspartate kinase [Sphingobacteriales bacterium 39-19]